MLSVYGDNNVTGNNYCYLHMLYVIYYIFSSLHVMWRLLAIVPGGTCHESCVNAGQLNCWGSALDQCQKRELTSCHVILRPCLYEW